MKEKYSKSEVGHVINVGNLHKLNELIQTYGEKYNPSRDTLKLIELRKRFTQCNELIGLVLTKIKLDNKIVNNRKNAFDAMDKLSTRVFNAAAAVAEDDKDIEDLQGYIDKLRGEPAMPQTNEDEVGQEIKEARSNAQLSFINRANHFRGLIEHIDGFENYEPNEEDLKLPALKAVLADLEMHNRLAATSEKELEKAIIERNFALYDPKTGLYKTTKRVKRYIKSVFGAESDQFAQASGIKFTNIRKKKKQA